MNRPMTVEELGAMIRFIATLVAIVWLGGRMADDAWERRQRRKRREWRERYEQEDREP